MVRLLRVSAVRRIFFFFQWFKITLVYRHITQAKSYFILHQGWVQQRLRSNSAVVPIRGAYVSIGGSNMVQSNPKYVSTRHVEGLISSRN